MWIDVKHDHQYNIHVSCMVIVVYTFYGIGPASVLTEDMYSVPTLASTRNFTTTLVESVPQ